MPDMTNTEYLDRRAIWEVNGNQLLDKQDIERFDRFFEDLEESAPFRSPGFVRALSGDYSQYETVEPMLKGYLGAKKCYDLYERYNGDSTNPALQEELKNRLMEADLRTGFAFGGKNPTDDFSRFMRDCGQIANRQMLLQTLNEPDPTAKLRLLNQFKQNNADNAKLQLNAALNKDLEQRVEIAKLLFMNHLGKFQTLNQQNEPMEMNENMSEIYAHGGRTMFILPAGDNQKRVMEGIKGQHPDHSGLQKRSFATHAAKPRKFNADGTIAAEAKELKLNKVQAYSRDRHNGMNVSIGGLGQVGPNGKLISSDGTNGHMYMHLVEGNKNTCGMMLVGFENSAPQTKGRLDSTHDASAKKAGSSTFLSDKSCIGKETGGRVVDLSGLPADKLGDLLNGFENAYRNAAKAAQLGNSQLLDACNDLLTGKLMSVGQLKGMLQKLDVAPKQIESVEAARAGHPAAKDHKPIIAADNPPIPMKVDANPAKKPYRITECDGLVRPKPPVVMKKPGLLDKLIHRLSIRKNNTYVTKYNEHQRTLPEQLATYRDEMETYRSTLESLEQGGNPRGLRAAYERAIKEAEKTLGISQKEASAPQAQNKAAVSQPKPTSPQMVEQLENTLLDSLMKDSVPANSSPKTLEGYKAVFRGQIRNTQSYTKLSNSGDENVSKILQDPASVKNVLTKISQEIMENSKQGRAQEHNPNVPRMNRETEVVKQEMAPRGLS